jgi:hypothetical protein
MDLFKPVNVAIFLFLLLVSAFLFYTGAFNSVSVGIQNFFAQQSNMWIILVLLGLGGYILFHRYQEGLTLKEARPWSYIELKQRNKYPDDWETKIEDSRLAWFYRFHFKQMEDSQTPKASYIGVAQLAVDVPGLPLEVYKGMSALDVSTPKSQWVTGRGNAARMPPYLRQRAFDNYSDLACGYPGETSDKDELRSLKDRGLISDEQYADLLGSKGMSVSGGQVVSKEATVK